MKNKIILPTLIASATLLNTMAGPRVSPGQRLLKDRKTISLDKALSLDKKMRTTVDSGWFHVDEDALEFRMTYNGWDKRKNERIRNSDISKKALDMIKNANDLIIASVFLFDNMHADNNPKYDVVGEITKLLIDKKKENPQMTIVVILDPLNRAYSRRVSDSVEEFRKNGIDVYYSDMLATKGAMKYKVSETIGHINRVIDKLTLGLSGSLLGGAASLVNLPGELDGHKLDLEVGFGVALGKANHRKILVTDIKGEDTFESLVTSANPHNASDESTNTAISVKGDLAKFIYGVLREDALQSLKLESQRPIKLGAEKYAYLSDETRETYKLPRLSAKKLKRYAQDKLPVIDFKSLEKGSEAKSDVKIKFVSEGEVKKDILRLLKNAQPEDKVRIQMFYLSEPEVVDAIAKVAKQEGRKDNPVQIILDPSKDAFNAIKDGTPNRQTAHYLMNMSGDVNLELRWYSTHGEQNHAKIMTITNEKTGKYEMTTGSTNWTGKNMNDINMEANLSVAGSKAMNDKFNAIFDTLWSNKDEGVLYTWDYNSYDLHTTRNLVEGYKVIKNWDNAKKEKWIERHLDEIRSVFFKKNADVLSIMSEEQKDQWLKEKIAKDNSSLTRVMSYIVGSAVVGADDTPAKRKKWERKYMKKWTRGEANGYVAW